MTPSAPNQDLTAVMKNALQQIRELKAKLAEAEKQKHEPIALIGIGCRFPQGNALEDIRTPEQFWTFLRNGGNAITETPADRWDVAATFDPDPAAPGKTHIRHGGFLAQVDGFEPPFFNLAPREAITLDPQQRLLLEVSWEALEHANIVPSTLVESATGVFIGISGSDYATLLAQDNAGANLVDDLYGRTGVDSSVAAGRLSYVLGLTGPCIAVDTACSSSLVAIHQACQSLRQHECDLALAGGVALMLSPENTIAFSKAGMLAADGRCKTFDAAADGYVRGEGCGIVVLKRLSDAQAAGDNILATIRGSMINHDGPSSGLTVPRGPSQQTVIRQALKIADINPAAVSYIEAHGTGTPLGDPIELGALRAIFRQRTEPLWIGSVKTNIGHLEAAAGIAGLIKVVLMLQHGQIPPHLHFQTPTPHVDWTQTPVQVPTTLTEWTVAKPGAERIAGISSFGYSGTNAHVLLSSPPEVVHQAAESAQTLPVRPRHLLTLAAKTAPALADLVKAYQTFLAEQTPTFALADICYTAHTSRSHFAHRLAVTAASSTELQNKLTELARGEKPLGVVTGQVVLDQAAPKIAFLFTGQGAQYVGMGRELYQTSPTFRAALDRCDALLQAQLGESLLAVLYPETEDQSSVISHQSTVSSRLDDTTYTQPALFMLEYALATLWQSWGVQPEVLIGHSVGEVAAACVAGVFSLEDGLKLIAARGRLMGALPQDGAMVSLLATEARVQAALAPYRDTVAIAAVNGPESIVISGKRAAVQQVVDQFAAEGVKSRPLTVSHAFHSPLMDPMLDAFCQVAASITYHMPTIPLVSNVTGQLAGAEVTTPEYWVRHVREAVRFADGVATLHAQGIETFLEIGPKPVLVALAQQNTGESSANSAFRTLHAALYLPSLREHQSDWQQLLDSLGELYVHGVAIDWPGFAQDDQRRKVVLPTYPFQRQRYWINQTKTKPRLETLRPLIDKMIKSPAIKEILFETALSVETVPYLTDHRIEDTVVAPGACHLAMMMSAAELAFGRQTYQLTDVIFPQPLALADTETQTAQLILTPLDGNGAGPSADIRLISFAANETNAQPATHATGKVGVARQQPEDSPLRTIQARCTVVVPTEADPDATIRFGPAFCWLAAAWRSPVETPDKREVLAKLRRPEAIARVGDYPLHPGLLDACFQAVGLVHEPAEGTELYLPFALAAFSVYQAAEGDTWWCHAEQVDAEKWNIQLFDQAGTILAEISEFRFRAVAPGALQATRVRTDWLYTLNWQAAPVTQPVPTDNPPACWLMMGSASALDTNLRTALQTVAPSGTVFFASAAEAATNGSVIRQLVATLAAQYRSVGVVYLGDKVADVDIPAQALDGCSALLHLVQALMATSLAVRLWIVTQGCQPVDGKMLDEHAHTAGQTAAAGALWGLGRTLAEEQPSLHPLCIDLPAEGDVAQQVALLQQELRAGLHEQPETQVAYRNGMRYVAQLQPWQPPSIIDKAQPMQLRLKAYGALENLQWAPLTRRPPGPGELEVEVKAAGLNFRDVLNALGMLQEYYAAVLGITDASQVGLGFECAGVVTAVGAGVSGFAVGDRVMGLGGAEGAFASYITVSALQMTPIPTQMSDSEAATIPLTFLTAWYGLVELAHLKPGERVLIHAAAGGVGQAAVQIAQAIGAEVIATASPGKWAFLRQQGIAHVMNSRTLDFTAQVQQITGGRGVDVVFNSLNGAFIDQSFAVLAQRGRFVEIGKIGIWSQEQVQQQRPDATYYPFDLGEVLTTEPALYTRLWQALTDGFRSGVLLPLPATTFPAQESISAFRYMQQAKQVGKIVLTFAAAKPVVIQRDATYLITGGLGALGLQMAAQLVEDGARQLILTGRRGPTTDEQRQAIAQLAEAGAEIQVIPADIAKAEDVQALLDRCAQNAPLRGIVHAAGILDDGIVTEQTRDRFATVMQPKVAGAWHLHTLTQTLKLDFFVCFSSAASLVGSPGQSNYAAANAFMDTLMQQRQRAGLPGLSINWEAWSEIGMAAGLQARLQAQGVMMIAPQQGRVLFRYLLQQPVAQIGVLPLRRQPEPEASPSKRADLREQLANLPEGERQPYLDEYLHTELTTVLGLRTDTPIDPHTRLFDFGLDSLMAVELKNKLEARLACSLRSTLLFDYPTLSALTPYLLHEVLDLAVAHRSEPAMEQPGTMPAVAPSAPAELDELSDDEISDMLLAKLDNLGY